MVLRGAKIVGETHCKNMGDDEKLTWRPEKGVDKSMTVVGDECLFVCLGEGLLLSTKSFQGWPMSPSEACDRETDEDGRKLAEPKDTSKEAVSSVISVPSLSTSDVRRLPMSRGQ